MTVAVSQAQLVERFTQEAVAAGGVLHGPLEHDDALAAVAAIVHDSGTPRVLAWHPAALGLAAAWQQLAELGVTAECPHLPADAAQRAGVLAELDDVAVGLTSAVGALADTGTLVLASGRDRPRLAWLLPPVHVALVHIRDIRADMASFFADSSLVLPGDAAHLAFVTGPSRTADIELTLTRGVHGPKSVHIVLVM
jgi:L-lactate dehydrogenase complex protein LldG